MMTVSQTNPSLRLLHILPARLILVIHFERSYGERVESLLLELNNNDYRIKNLHLLVCMLTHVYLYHSSLGKEGGDERGKLSHWNVMIR